MEQKAYFVLRPRRIDEMQTAAEGEWRAYQVVSTIRLRRIDYDNFAADLLADRAFLDNDSGCADDGRILRCMRVTCRDRNTILVLPDGNGHVAMAAMETTSSRNA
ncbi:MAG: hypothetical protein IJJ99_05400 [Oscillospiraceae bacterium]|nr:hypothetical protein [Oscillospiraceae bacterium]